jgi:hypothetical protein
MEACPSTFALDDREIHGEKPAAATAGHAASCPRCQARIAARERLRDRFESQVSGPLWARVVAARRPRAWKLPAFLASTAAAAGLTAVLIAMAGPAGGPDVRVKGQAAVEILGRRQGHVFSFEPGIAARPGDELQISVRAARPDERHVLVGSVDGTGRFSPFYPSALEGRSLPIPGGGQPLAPPIVLDDGPGPERILVVLSAEPLSAREVAGLAERAAASGGGDLAIPGVARATVRWLVLPKSATAESP